MVRVMTFADALEDAQRRSDELSVLLGNGFSIDYNPDIFSYESLASEAALTGLSVDKASLFDQLESSNFEVVIDKLRASAKLQRLYGGDEELADLLDADALVVGNGLADALAARHPNNAQMLTDDEVLHARTFLSPFLRIFTLSYDLLLYWVVNRDDRGAVWVSKSDGFEWPTFRERERLVWKIKPGRPQRVFFLHGALHLFVEDKRLTKLHMGYGTSIVEGLRERLNELEYPHVVTEGTRAEKEARIELWQVVGALAEEAGEERARFALVLGLTGLRPGELVAMRVRDVQRVPVPAFRVTRSKTDDSPLRHTTKGGKARSVPLVAEAWAVVEPMLAGRDAEDLLFPSTRGGFMTLDGWRDAVRWERHAMGRRVYELRHTFATSALLDGINLLALQKWMGHASISTTEKYLHYVGTDADTAALARLNAAADARRSGAGGARLES